MIIVVHNDQDETSEFYEFHNKIEHILKMGGSQCDSHGGSGVCVHRSWRFGTMLSVWFKTKVLENFSLALFRT